MWPHCGAYYSNCAVIGHSTCQMAIYVTGSGRMSYCNQTLFLSKRVGSGDEIRTPKRYRCSATWLTQMNRQKVVTVASHMAIIAKQHKLCTVQLLIAHHSCWYPKGNVVGAHIPPEQHILLWYHSRQHLMCIKDECLNHFILGYQMDLQTTKRTREWVYIARCRFSHCQRYF